MIYLKVDDEATFTAALKKAGWAWDDEYRVEVDSEGNETVTEDVMREAGMEAYTHTHSLDIIGVIQRFFVNFMIISKFYRLSLV